MKQFLIVLVCLSLVSGVALPWCSNDLNQPGNRQHKKVKNGTRKYLCSYKTKDYYKGKLAGRYYKGTTCTACGCDSSEHRNPVKRAGKKTMPQKVAMATIGR